MKKHHEEHEMHHEKKKMHHEEHKEKKPMKKHVAMKAKMATKKHKSK
jgi:hypothetical protein